MGCTTSAPFQLGEQDKETPLLPLATRTFLWPAWGCEKALDRPSTVVDKATGKVLLQVDGNQGHDNGIAWRQKHALRSAESDLVALLISDTLSLDSSHPSRDRMVMCLDGESHHFTLWHSAYTAQQRFDGQPASAVADDGTPLYLCFKASLHTASMRQSNIYLAKPGVISAAQPDFVVEANGDPRPCTQFRIRRFADGVGAFEIGPPPPPPPRGSMGDLTARRQPPPPQPMWAADGADAALMIAATMAHVRLVTESLMMNPHEYASTGSSCGLFDRK